MKQILMSLAVVSLAGCAGMTPTHEKVEGYRIYDISTAYSSGVTQSLAANIRAAMQKNAKDVQFNNQLPPDPLPAQPGRFQLINPFQGATGYLALAGANAKVPQCPGSVIQATSHDSFTGAEQTTFFVCLMPYQQGYAMNVYYTYDKVSGGISAEALGRALAQSVAGDSSQFIPRTVAALEQAVKSTNLQPTLKQAYP